MSENKDFEYVFPWEKEPSSEKKDSYRNIKKLRKDWDSFFMGLVRYLGNQSPCLKKGVGAILIKDRRILAEGYNGSPKGIPHCKSCARADEDLKSYSVCPAVHAEVNCIAMCAQFGVSSKDSILYCEYFPCSPCCGVLINSGIKEIVYEKPPVDKNAMLLALKAGIFVRKWNSD